MNKPKISIVTITYNSERTLEDTIKSVAAQNYDNLEYLIIDGGSTDRTLEIAEKYKDVVTYLKSEPDNGISDAFNKGVKAATGELIGIINSDDMLCDGALNTLAEAWDGKTDVYYGDAVVCDEQGNNLSILCSKEDLSQMPYGFCIVHPATFVTKSAYERYGYFRVELKCAMDYDLLLRYYKKGASFRYIHSNLSVYRSGGVNQKMRSLTIQEVYDVSVFNGGKKSRAAIQKYKKILTDRIRPVLNLLHIHNKRVKKL